MPQENTLLQWQTIEFEPYEKGFGWYLTLVIIVLMLVIYEIFMQDYFAALTMFIIGVGVFMFARQRPQEVHAVITDQGIYLNKFYIPFHNIKQFWIVDHDLARSLHLETNAYLNHYVVIALNDQDPEVVAKTLRPYLQEGERNFEPISHKIGRKLKF